MKKKSVWIMILSTVLACSSLSAEASIGRNNLFNAKKDASTAQDAAPYVRLMPDVDLSMMQADYWIEKCAAPDDVVMTPDQIQTFNQKLLEEEKCERRKYDALAREDGTRYIERDTLVAYLDESEVMSPAYDKKGKAIPSSKWDEWKKNENYESIQDKQPVSYGFAVKRGNLRQFPTKEVVTQDNPFTFFDEMQNSTMLVGEPVIVPLQSKDKKWSFVISNSCCGWTKNENIAMEDSYESWKAICDSKDFLLVTGDEIELEYDPVNSAISEARLTMGARIPLASKEECLSSKEGREAFGNYLVKMPTRQKDGKIQWEYAYVPFSRDVHVGYLSYTRRNLLEQVFKTLGDRYGWGGMYAGRDCSQYIMEVFRCFGIYTARNSTGMANMICETVDVTDQSVETKKEKLADVPVGSILFIRGHVMIYLGRVDGRDYVISSSASSILEGKDDPTCVHSVVINTLTTKRKNGLTWLECIEKYKIIK